MYKKNLFTCKYLFFFQAICKAADHETENDLYTVATLQTRGNSVVCSLAEPTQQTFRNCLFIYNYENLEIAGGIDSSSNNRDCRANVI